MSDDRSLVNVCVLCVLCATVCFSCRPIRAGHVDHVVHVSVDGLHANLLLQLIDIIPDAYPNFKRFVEEGSTTFNARTDVDNTFTLPNHTTIVTGRPVLSTDGEDVIPHGYTNNGSPSPTATLHNSGNLDVSYVASVFDRAHDHGLSTAMFSTKSKFVIYEQSYNFSAEANGGRPDQYLEDGDHGTNKIDRYQFELTPNYTSVDVIDTFVEEMSNDPYDYSFVHLVEPDVFGHTYGWGHAIWTVALTVVDEQLGRIFELVEASAQLSDRTAIILTSDHGGNGKYHTDTHDVNVYTIPFFAWGPAITRGADIYSLNQETRLDPELLQPSYFEELQPIRNGGSANLALSLLGLPAIEGSSINAAQDLRLAIPGDADLDGNVSFSDFSVVASNFGNAGRWQDGDFGGDGNVEFGDFTQLALHFGQSVPVVALPISPVPEPIGLSIFVPLFLLNVRWLRGYTAARRLCL